MRSVYACLTVVLGIFLMQPAAQAQCAGGPTASCVTAFSVSPGAITGDGVQTAFGQATAHLGTGVTTFLLEIKPGAGFGYTWYCLPPAFTYAGGGGGAGYAGGCGVDGSSTISVIFYGLNQTPNPVTIHLAANYGYDNVDAPIPADLTLNPIPPPQAPPQEPDTSCPSGQCGFGGKPINFSNGNTWITQTDYSIPGLGGGLALTRTWNSLWALMQPPETSGLFGDSWRSNFEERIQSLTGGVVKYWKGNGSSLFYQYNSLTGVYSLTAPLDDQTTLSFSSTTNKWTIVQKDGTQKIFNNAGYLTSIVDRNGNTTNIVVDAANQNRISSVTDAGGRTLTLGYTNATFPRLCTSIADSVGTVATYTYDASGRLSQVQYADASQFNFQFNDPNSTTLISGVTDSQGKTIEAHTYDSQRRGITSQEANGVNKVTVNQYTSNGANIYDSIGDYTTLTFATVGQRHYLSTVGGFGCNSCGFSELQANLLTPSGNVMRTGDPYGFREWTYTYDGQGNVASVSYPYGGNILGLQPAGFSQWQYAYNSFGEVLTATDPLQHITTNAYDTHGNLLSVTTPSPDGTTAASVTVFTYYANGTLKTIKDPLLHVTTLTYFPTGLINTIKDANNKVTTYAYDGRGNRTSIIDPVNGSAHPTTFGYDAMNRLTSITYPNATSNPVQFHYDYRGRRDWVIDQNGMKTTYGYDDADRLISVTDAQAPTPGVTQYTYDTENNVTDIYDASNNHTHFVYNARGGKISQATFPSGYSEYYTWDNSFNNLTSKTDRNGNNISYIYDFSNRVYRKLYPGGAVTQFDYDIADRLSSSSDANGNYTFSYDNMNRLTQVSTDYTFDTAGALTVKYGYDAASNRNSMTDPQNLPTSYGYDILNRLTSLAFNGQNPGFAFGYDALSRRTSLTRPNAVNTTYAYNSVSQLVSVLHKLGTTTLDGATYINDNVGNRTSRTDKRTNTTLNYTYDNIYQLLTAKQGATTKESYTYDLVGNRLSSLGVSPYQYNSSNQLTSTPSLSYTYDNNGNTKTKSDGTVYTWDYENRLSQVTLPGSGGTVTFRYDPFGRRVQKQFVQGTTTTTTDYLYDGDDLLEEIDNSGNVLARYTHGQGFDQALSMLRSGATSYYQSDVLSTITSLSNSSSALANTYSYDSFGKLTASTGTLTNPFQFTGREFDPETGTYYYRMRYYDQGTGRFLSEDPIRFQGGIDFYAYALNSPVNWIDPFGLEVQECRRPLNLPHSGNLPPHMFVYSTQSGTGYGLGPKSNWWAAWGAESGKPVPGNIEKDYPYDPSGKLKPNYQCSKVSDDKCFEDCVNQKSLDATRNPPSYQLGVYQCDTWANDIERQCRQQCKKK